MLEMAVAFPVFRRTWNCLSSASLRSTLLAWVFSLANWLARYPVFRGEAGVRRLCGTRWLFDLHIARLFFAFLFLLCLSVLSLSLMYMYIYISLTWDGGWVALSNISFSAVCRRSTLPTLTLKFSQRSEEWVRFGAGMCRRKFL